MSLAETIHDIADDERPWVPEDTFGGRLALIRQRLHKNVKEAAEMCDIGVQTWRNWEAGVSPRNFEDVAQQIADALRVDYIWLLTGVASPGSNSRCTGTNGLLTAVHDDGTEAELRLWDEEWRPYNARAGLELVAHGE